MREPWGKRYTGGPRGWNAIAWGIVMGLFGVIVVLAGLVYSTLIIEPPKLPPPWIEVIGLAGVAFFSAFVITMPVAYAWTKYCYDRPPAKAGDNVTVTGRTRERPDSNRIGGRRMYQTGPTSWRIVDDLPDGVSTAVMEDWMRDVWREQASWNVPSGRERGLDDDVVKRVKEWLEDRGLIDIAANGQWEWTDRGERLCEHLERGYDLGALLDGRPTETEV